MTEFAMTTPKDIIENIRSWRLQQNIPFIRREEVPQVILVCASSRGGSSYLYRSLAKSLYAIAPRGEQNPFFRPALSTLSLTGSDYLGKIHFDPEIADLIWNLLFWDLGIGFSNEFMDPELYERIVTFRLLLQWPDRLCLDTIQNAISRLHTHNIPQELLFPTLVNTLSANGNIDIGYYDRDPLLSFPYESQPVPGPPGANIYEEPPFISVFPRRVPNASEFQTYPLILKSSLNAYQLEYYRSFFPNSEIKILHLTRNPAAAINGLIDGWHHWGFFSHNLEDTGCNLAIKGYSDIYPWGQKWWKFDLFPNWKEATTLPLARVCAQQWLQSHQHIMTYCGANPQQSYLRIPYENLIHNPASHQTAMEKIISFLNTPLLPHQTSEGTADIVMATIPPRPGRWRDRQKELIPVCANADIQAMAEMLGYSFSEVGTWI